MAAPFQFKRTPQEVPPVDTKFRTIQTMLPVPESLPILAESEKYEPTSFHGQLPIVWDRAVDFQIYDAWGNRWIDQTSTIFVTNAGHSNPDVIRAIKAQLDKPLLHTYCYPSTVRIELVKKLLSISPAYMEKALLLSTGAESVECGVKLMRSYGRKQDPKKQVLISFMGSFHGKTLGAQMIGGKPKDQEWIGYMDPYMHHMDFPFPWVLAEHKMNGAEYFAYEMKRLEKKGVSPTTIAGFFVETYQGWNAAFLDKEFVQAMRAWANEHHALMTFDEVQSGFGRTGKWFAFEHYDVKADIICCGKGISSSLPLSAVISTKKILDIDPTLTSTHAGNPVSAAAGIANLDYLITHDLIEASRKKGEFFRKELEALKAAFPERIGDIIGTGLVYGVLITKRNKKGPLDLDIELANHIVEKAFQKGVLLIQTGCGTLKFGPPLTIPEDALKETVHVLKECITELDSKKS